MRTEESLPSSSQVNSRVDKETRRREGIVLTKNKEQGQGNKEKRGKRERGDREPRDNIEKTQGKTRHHSYFCTLPMISIFYKCGSKRDW